MEFILLLFIFLGLSMVFIEHQERDSKKSIEKIKNNLKIKEETDKENDKLNVPFYHKNFINQFNKYKFIDPFFIELKQYEKMKSKYFSLCKLLNKEKYNLLEESLNKLLDNSFKNLIMISKVKRILDELDEEKLSKKNKKLYQSNLDFFEQEKEKFKESLELYDYIMLKIIDIEAKGNYDYLDIKLYIDNLIDLSNQKNNSLDTLEEKYLNVDLNNFSTSSFKKNLESLIK